MDQAAEGLEAKLARLDREYSEAYRAYNDALSALDRALEVAAPIPEPHDGLDPSPLDELAGRSNLIPDGPPSFDGPIKGRLRRMVWRLLGPALDRQTQFNLRLVDHLRQQAAAHERARATAKAILAWLRRHAEARAAFQSHLIQFLQTITPLVDTKDRSQGGRVDVVMSGVNTLAQDWMKRWESLTTREARLVQRLAPIDDLRATVAIAQQTALSLKRDVERLLASSDPARPGATPAPVDVPDLDAFKYLGFEEAFRGPAEEISRRLAGYVPRFLGQTDVLDIGCGRGEFLELLKAHGVRARGVDTNDAMVEHARARGLDVARGDALGYLSTLEDRSLGGIFASQVVEHLPPDYLMKVLETARHKLRPGGLVVLETINPACWTAFFESFIRDLTHVKALHPDTLQYLLRVSGFTEVTIEFLSPIPEPLRLQRMAEFGGDTNPLTRDVVETFNENVEKLNARLFTFQDYAAIGRA